MRFPRERQAHCRQRRTHPLAQFPDDLIGETDDGENPRPALTDMDLHIDFARFDPRTRPRRHWLRSSAPLEED